jgi:hypothetical protein
MGHIKSAGLGHKLTEVMLGMTFALDTQSTYVFDKDIFSTPNKHEVYHWLPTFLPLHQFEVTFRDIENQKRLQQRRIRTVSGQYDDLIQQSERELPNGCHNNNTITTNNNNNNNDDDDDDIVFYKTMLNKCCRPNNMNREHNNKDCYCSKDSYRIGSADRVKWRFRHAYSKSKYVPSITSLLEQQQNNSTTDSPNSNNNSNNNNNDDDDDDDDNAVDVTIVWHLRVGDIVLNNQQDYFWNISKQFITSLKMTNNKIKEQQRRRERQQQGQQQQQRSSSNNNITRTYEPHVFFIGEGGRDIILQHFPFLPQLCAKFFNNQCHYPVLDVPTTLYHMIASDVLITSGSSFASIAGIIRTKGVLLQALPKGGTVGITEVSEGIQMDQFGNIPIGQLEDALWNFVQQTDRAG